LEGSNPIPRFIDHCLDTDNLQGRVPADVRDRIHQIIWNWAPELASLDTQSQLVHSDWSHRNLLVRRTDGRWRVAAILDWEFAVAYTPLTDIGHFLLRHERRSMDIIEPEFIRGYLDGGGTLPENWRQLARLVDLMAICEGLTHAHLPEAATKELVDLVQLASLNVLQR
jgi:aminoglycoside phosphotransferase (APT) family kinase protein